MSEQILKNPMKRKVLIDVFKFIGKRKFLCIKKGNQKENDHFLAT